MTPRVLTQVPQPQLVLLLAALWVSYKYGFVELANGKYLTV